MIRAAVLALTCTGVLVACTGDATEEDMASRSSAAVTTSWRLPADIKAAGAQVRITYDGAPAWTGKCPSASLLVGARELGQYLRDTFTAVSSVGGYSCRQNTANKKMTSVHGTGRALDVFIPLRAGAADSVKGDALANWLVTNASEIGVQLIIWNRTVWRANGTNERAYTGPHPHDDHLHVEITSEAAAKLTPWFSTMGGAPIDEDAGQPSAEPPIDDGADDEIEEPSPPAKDAGDASVPEQPEEPEAPDAAPPPEAPSDPGEAPRSSDDDTYGDDEPGERDSLDTRSKRSSRPGAMQSSGCGVTPAHGGEGALLVVAAFAWMSLRRRRRV